MKKISVLILSLLTLMAGAVLSPLLSGISNEYSTVSPVFIKSLVTIPSLLVFLLPFLLPQKFINFYSNKTILLIGLLLYSIGGLIPSLFKISFSSFMFCRIILGIGLGLIAPRAVSSINTIYEGKEKEKMLGYAGAMNNLGTITAVLFSGFLGTYNWKNGLWIYWISVIAFILLLIYFPKESSKSNHTVVPKNMSLNAGLISIYLTLFLITIIYFIIPTNLSFYISTITDHNITTITGVLMAITSGAGVISGVFFSKIYDILKERISSVLFLSFFLSMLIIYFHFNIYFLLIALPISGFSLGIGIPYFNKKIIQYSKGQNESKTIEIGTSLLFLGQFVSPFFIDFFRKLLQLPISTGTFLIGSLLSLVLLLINSFVNKKDLN
ncbi:hypothetical protein IGM04_002756 [Enterococcus sp. DIV2385]|uniref:MFS transporter n=1 Tax=Enterococcus TaxID=1350 RepID=UPI001A0004FE|nr:MFS transporter [Enterococcus faecalis]